MTQNVAADAVSDEWMLLEGSDWGRLLAARFSHRIFFLPHAPVSPVEFMLLLSSQCPPKSSSLEINPSAFTAAQKRRFDNLDDTGAFICGHGRRGAILDARADALVKPNPTAAFGRNEFTAPLRLKQRSPLRFRFDAERRITGFHACA